MYFSDIVKTLEAGNFIFNDKSPYVYQIKEGKALLSFTLEKVVLTVNKEDYELTYKDFSLFDVKEFDDKGKPSALLSYKDIEVAVLPIDKMEKCQLLISQLQESFSDEKCSPKFQIDSIVEAYDVDVSNLNNNSICKLFLLYKDRLEEAINNDFIKTPAVLYSFLEEDSGKIIDNLGETAKKNFGKLLSGDWGGLVKVAVSAGTRSVQGMVNNIISEKDFLLLTDKNVIICKKGDINGYDFSEILDNYKAKDDESLAGVVDIFDDMGNLVLNNIAKTDWNSFKIKLKNLNKESESKNNEEIAAPQDSMDELKTKIKKLKDLVDEGLLSEEEFEKKKKDLLDALI